MSKRAKVLTAVAIVIAVAVVFCAGFAVGKESGTADAVPFSKLVDYNIGSDAVTVKAGESRFIVVEKNRGLKQSYEIIRDTETGAEYLLYRDAGVGFGLCPLVK